MGGPIAMERKEQETTGCPDVKHSHYVTSRQRILWGTGVTYDVSVSVDLSSFSGYSIHYITSASVVSSQLGVTI